MNSQIYAHCATDAIQSSQIISSERESTSFPILPVPRRKFIVYRMTNVITSEIYVGKTNNIVKRMSTHRKSKNTGLAVHDSIQFWGWHNFEIDILFQTDDEDESLQRESDLIAFFKCDREAWNNGYGLNEMSGGSGSKSYTDEKKQRHSERMKKVWEDQGIRQRHKEACRKATSQPEYRLKMSASQHRRWKSKAERLRSSKVSKRNWNNPEYRENILASMTRRWDSAEVRRVHGEKMRARLQNPEVRKRMSDGLKAKWQDPSYRKQMSDAFRASWKRRLNKRDEQSNGETP